MTIVQEGQILIEPEGKITVQHFEIKDGTLHDLMNIAFERILLAVEKEQNRRELPS